MTLNILARLLLMLIGAYFLDEGMTALGFIFLITGVIEIKYTSSS